MLAAATLLPTISAMAVVIASDLGKDIAGEPLLRGISFKLERRDRMTLSGRNGAGKTTLLRMLSGEASVDFGELVLAKDAKVALHDQRPPRERDLIAARVRAVRGARAGGDRGGAGVARAGDGRRRPRRGDARPLRRRRRPGSSTPAATAGANARWRRCTASASATTPTSTARSSTFSGGELTRASLGRALAGAPDLLLLDEPTNHLDIESLEWLEQHLVGLDAAIVLVAHDRWFLEAVGTSVLELEAGRGKFFTGPWHAWRREKAARELALGRAIERQQAEIERLERFVTRFRAGTRARQAQSRARSWRRSTGSPAARPTGRRSSSRSSRPSAAAGWCSSSRTDASRSSDRVLLDDAELWLERGRARVAGRAQRRRQDDADRDACRAGAGSPRRMGRARWSRASCGPGTTSSSGFLSQHAEELSAGHGAHGARGHQRT